MSAPNGKGSGRRLLLFCTAFASLGVFLFGYDQGVMSGILTGPYFKAYFHQPTRLELATMVSVLELAALITSLLAGILGDLFGRRAVIFSGACIFTVGGLFQAFCGGFRTMVFGRILSGFGVGFLSMCVPVYQSEISPAEERGRMGCIEFTLNVTGYATSVWIDYFCSYLSSDLSWRLPLLFQSVIGLTLAIGTLFLPESPRFLLDIDADEEGLSVLADLHADGDVEDERAKEEWREIKEGVIAERAIGDRSYKSMWKRYRYRVLIAMSAQIFAQLNGINVISYYAPLVFESAGWIGRDAILMTGINGIIYVLSTIPTWYLVDTLGRRPILLSGASVMAVSLTLVGFFLYLDQSYTPQAVVAFVIIYNASFGYSFGPVPWLYPPEILPNAFRVKGVSLSTAANWAGNYLVGEATPILQELIGWRLYPMHAGFCVISFVGVWAFYPETMGVPLEEMDELFGDQPLAPLLESSDEGSEEEGEDHRPSTHLHRSHSVPSFHRGLPHSHPLLQGTEPPVILPERRNHRRTLSGHASLPGRGSVGVEAVRGWWESSREGKGMGGSSRPTTPRVGSGFAASAGGGGGGGYQAVRQEQVTEDEEEEWGRGGGRSAP
ncbi:hypothetical protein JCM11641_007803 [Rhodosporidiobolus odoratus]